MKNELACKKLVQIKPLSNCCVNKTLNFESKITNLGNCNVAHLKRFSSNLFEILNGQQK